MAVDPFEINRYVFKLLQTLLLRVVRFKTIPELGGALVLSHDKPVFYALHIRQFSALLVLDEAVNQLGLPSATNAGSAATNAGSAALAGDPASVLPRSRFFFLTRRGQPSPLQRDAYRYSDRLTRLVQMACVDASRDIQIVPVSIFWGRSPINQDSLIKALFADNWVTPGFFSQGLRLLIHGRQTLLKFGTPISLQASLGENRDAGVALRRIARLLRAEFKRERERVLGPNLSHRQVLVNDVVASATVQDGIASEAIEQKKNPVTVELRARKLAFEIASDYSYPFIRAYDIGLSRLWNRIYDGVDIHGFDDIPKVANGAELIYLPCHRSHIDYLLLSYVIYQRGLQIPHIAAGENLNLPVIGALLRRGGAFFLRRSFKGDALYGQVFGEYLHTLIARGFPIEYFVEGGRSRTGRTLPPKLGLLAMTVESWLRGPTRPIVFIPIYIGYERVFEGNSYAAELAGQAKKRESVMGVVRSLRSLREQFGRVHVNIGEPLRIEDYVSLNEPDSKSSVSRLARSVVTRINSALVINPINLIALALGNGSSAGIDAALLEHLIDGIQSLMRTVPYSNRQQMTLMNGRQIIDYGLRLATIQRAPAISIGQIEADPEKAKLLGYFRNNIVHAVAIPSLLAALMVRHESIELSRLRRLTARIYPYLRAELFLWRDPEQLDAHIEELLTAMTAQGWMVLQSEDGSPGTPGMTVTMALQPSDLRERAALQRFARIMHGPLERYFLLIGLLANAEATGLTTDWVQERYLRLAQRLPSQFDDPLNLSNLQASLRTLLNVLLESGELRESGPSLIVSAELIAAHDDALWALPDEISLMLSHPDKLPAPSSERTRQAHS